MVYREKCCAVIRGEAEINLAISPMDHFFLNLSFQHKRHVLYDFLQEVA